MNINKFVFMVWFCNVNGTMLEQFGVYEATGHEIYRRGEKIGALFYFLLKS